MGLLKLVLFCIFVSTFIDVCNLKPALPSDKLIAINSIVRYLIVISDELPFHNFSFQRK